MADVNPLPYIIVFAILFILGLVALTWTLDEWYKSNRCADNPNVWCSDNWTCNTSCPTGSGYNVCFENLGTTGLSSCLFGPNSVTAALCYTTPTGTTATSCDCTAGMQAANNCFSGCASNLSNVPESVNCCCCPGQAGCPFTAETLPSSCRQQNITNCPAASNT